MAHQQTSKTTQPREGAFHNPAVPIAAEASAVVVASMEVVLAVRDDHDDAAFRLSGAKRVTVIGPVGDHAGRGFRQARPRPGTRTAFSVGGAREISARLAEAT